MQKMDILLLISIFSVQFSAHSLWFNGNDIDYWNENKKINTNKKNENIISYGKGNSEIRSKDSEKFDWNNYTSPSKIEFFDDGGDFVPNRPWREVMANPTKENIENFMAWQGKKIGLSNNITKMMAESSGMPTPLAAQPKLALNNPAGQSKTLNKNHEIKWKTLQVLYFYRSACHFCQASKPVVNALKEHDVLFIPVQLDWNENLPLYSNSVKYDENLDQGGYKVRGTPTWIIKRSDDSHAAPLIIEGYVSTPEMEKSVKSIF